MRAKIVNQSSDFPVRRTGSYRHKKALGVLVLVKQVNVSSLCVTAENQGRSSPKKWNIKSLFSRKAVKGQFLLLCL